MSSIGDSAFAVCDTLTGIYFKGNAPSVGGTYVLYLDFATVYYLPGTTGWGPTFGGPPTAFGGRPTALWVLPYPVILTTTPNFGVHTTQFGFRVSWATNATLVVEASASLSNPVWSPLQTNTLVDGWTDFSDPQWTNYPARFYLVRSL